MFGQVFKRNIKSTVEDLRKHFSGGGGNCNDIIIVKVLVCWLINTCTGISTSWSRHMET